MSFALKDMYFMEPCLNAFLTSGAESVNLMHDKQCSTMDKD